MSKQILQTAIIFVFTVLTTISFAQSQIVGKVDADGVPHFSASKNDCITELKKAASAKGAFAAMQMNDVSFTQMPQGQYCLTTYEKDAKGNTLRGLRIECKQDDDNNLIITSQSKIETVTGKSFKSSTL
ncbi:MAG: hypothetical protein JSS90_08070 [Bacteroidetes bacterium]|nr:hypothetical protein [Bacteroidota bacterium]